MRPSLTIGQWMAIGAGMGWSAIFGGLAVDWHLRRRVRRSDPDEGLRALRRACWRTQKELARVDRIATDLEHRGVDVA